MTQKKKHHYWLFLLLWDIFGEHPKIKTTNRSVVKKKKERELEMDFKWKPRLTWRACLESRVQDGVIDAMVDCNIDRWVVAVGWNNGV